MADYTNIDPDFGFDEFGRPNLTSAGYTLINNLLTILLAKPGNFPSQPTLGIDITQYLYSLEGDFDPTRIKAQIASQCSDFNDCIKDGTFDISLKRDVDDKPYIHISLPVINELTNKRKFVGIQISDENEQLFLFTFSDETDVVQEI